jgi:hypothetical protein
MTRSPTLEDAIQMARQAYPHLTNDQERTLHVYTAVVRIAFLGELVQRFNRDEPVRVDTAYQSHLEATLDAVPAQD